MTTCLQGGVHEGVIRFYDESDDRYANRVEMRCVHCKIKVQVTLMPQSDGSLKSKAVRTIDSDNTLEDNECNTEPQFDENDRDWR